MQAVVYHAPGDIRAEQVPAPTCGDDELLVTVDACAVCGTDFKSYKHGNPRIRAPLVMGHEFTGLVREVGPRAEGGFAIGDRVVMATSLSCGACFYCRRGWRNLCVDLSPMGFSYPGGMAEEVAIPGLALRGGHVVRVPGELPATSACLAEPVSCAVNALAHTELQPGETVLILGAGPLGLINACVARALGAGKVILSEINPLRLKQAEAFGCDRLIDPGKEDLAAIVAAETDGLGADMCVVAAPAAAAQEQAVALVRKRATIVLFASLPKGQSEITVDSRPIHYGELRVVGTSDSAPHHVEKAVELLASGAVPGKKLATHTLPLDEIQRAFELMATGEALRVVLSP
jgi:L-iditol 2-dehydrogenase